MSYIQMLDSNGVQLPNHSIRYLIVNKLQKKIGDRTPTAILT